MISLEVRNLRSPYQIEVTLSFGNHAGTAFENKSVSQTVIDAAKSREDARLFGYASEALNNGFFLSCLVRQSLASM